MTATLKDVKSALDVVPPEGRGETEGVVNRHDGVGGDVPSG